MSRLPRLQGYLPLALSASASFAILAAPYPARALTWNWSASFANSTSASGTFQTAGITPVIGQTYTIASIAGTDNLSGTSLPITGLSTFAAATNTFQWAGYSSPVISTFGGISWSVAGQPDRNLYCRFGSPSFCITQSSTFKPVTDIIFAPDASGQNPLAINSSSLSSVTEAVPGPLPLLGAAAAFGWSRRLRRRLRSATPMAQRKVLSQPQA